jgi:hypothetical protein
MKEIFKDIKGYEGLYQISNFGRVKSLDRVITKKGQGRHRLKEKILKPVKINTGYEIVSLWKKHIGKFFLISRLVAKAFIANSENKSCVHHKDHNPKNNYVNNLQWCSVKENLQHRHKKDESTSSLYKGVSFNKNANKWQAYIKTDKRIHLGYFIKEIEAALAYNQKAKELFGNFALLNNLGG